MIEEIKRLASYVTYRQLYSDGKCDIYFVVSKFAENIIKTKRLYSFGLTEIAEQINTEFQFVIPEYVIQSSLKRLVFISRENNMYIVNKATLSNGKDVVSDSMNCAAAINEKIANDLVCYVESKQGTLSTDQQKKLKQEFCSFLLDETTANGFSEMISAFILENNSNQDFCEQLLQIKEGAVLFAGLNYNSDIADGSAWKDNIVIYVENEILFHLAGYNGEVFQKLAEELFALIREMNKKSGKKVIEVRYFKEVFDDIESFFAKAVDIVEGKDFVSVDNYAMAEIVRGCNNTADIIDKKARFFSLLKNKGINKEEKDNFYDLKFHEYNLENKEVIEKYQLTEDKLRYIRHLNYVNILRRNVHSLDLKKSGYIVLTETGKILKMATELREEKNTTPLAVNMYILTNRLWFDLNRGFGADEFPSTFDVLVKARIVLSNILTQNLAYKYEQAKELFDKNEIDENQLADSILQLREEVKKPEDIDDTIVENILDFISEKQLEIHQSEKELLASKLLHAEKERDDLLNAIRCKEKETDELKKEAQAENEFILKQNKELLEKQKKDLMDQKNSIEKRQQKADQRISAVLTVIKFILTCVVLGYYIFVIAMFAKGNSNTQLIISFLLAIVPPAVNVLYSMLFIRDFSFVILYKKIIDLANKRLTITIYNEYSVDRDKLIELERRLVELGAIQI